MKYLGVQTPKSNSFAFVNFEDLSGAEEGTLFENYSKCRIEFFFNFGIFQQCLSYLKL